MTTTCPRCGAQLRTGDRHAPLKGGRCLVTALSRASVLALRGEIDDLLGLSKRRRKKRGRR